MTWDIIFLFFAMWLVSLGLFSFVTKLVDAVTLRKQSNFFTELMLVALGLTYIIWFCN